MLLNASKVLGLGFNTFCHDSEPTFSLDGLLPLI